MALLKKAIGACLTLLFCAGAWTAADSERPGQSEAVYPRGVESCRVCHQAIFDTFIRTAHFRTSSRAGASSIVGEGMGNGKGAFSDGRNILRTRTAGVFFKMERRGEDFYQTAVDSSENR